MPGVSCFRYQFPLYASSAAELPARLRFFRVNDMSRRVATLSQGRVEASEYWAKIHTVLDAIRLNRTDAAMVRVISPIGGEEPSDEVAAERASVALVTTVFPLLGRYLPE